MEPDVSIPYLICPGRPVSFDLQPLQQHHSMHSFREDTQNEDDSAPWQPATQLSGDDTALNGIEPNATLWHDLLTMFAGAVRYRTEIRMPFTTDLSGTSSSNHVRLRAAFVITRALQYNGTS